MGILCMHFLNYFCTFSKTVKLFQHKIFVEKYAIEQLCATILRASSLSGRTVTTQGRDGFWEEWEI